MKHQVKYQINKRLVTTFGLAIELTLFGATIIFSRVSATIGTNKNDISVNISGYCSVSNENHKYDAEIGTGTSAEIGSGNVFDIYCNDENGYVVYAVGNGKDASGDGVAKEGITDLIGSNTSNVIHTDIAQGGDESGWSFKLSNATSGMVIEDGFSDNSLIPSTRTKVVSRPAGTAAANGDNFTATYSAYISTSQESDTYTGGVKYILFHPSTTVFYEINYNLNDGTWTGTSPETGTEAGGYVNISPITPTKDEYDFKGWCNTQVTNNNSSSPTCSGQTYQPGNGVELPNSNNVINLYAIWLEPSMQDFKCTLGDEQTTTIKDSRDGNIYHVAKLKDGKCWMTDNLKIQGRTLTKDNSDVSSNFNLPSSVASPNSNNQFNQSFVHVDTQYGGYYTWFAATAGEGQQSFNSGDTQYSICPKGWKLPAQSDFQALATAYNNNNTGQLLQSPANFKLGGYYYSGSLQNTSINYGNYWSSTAYSGNINYAYFMSLSNSSVDPIYYSLKHYLMSVRCVARQ